MGFIILLMYNSRNAHVLKYSKKSKRVVLSIMGGKTYAFADGFDRVFMLRKDIERKIGANIPLLYFID